jgi:hypothetical protein
LKVLLKKDAELLFRSQREDGTPVTPLFDQCILQGYHHDQHIFPALID